ncbi:MAG: DUF58 domain-containing protein [Acidobacteriota bacterium]
MAPAAAGAVSALFDNEFLASLEKLSLMTKRARASGDRGTRRGARRGASVEFADHRSYEPGDDYRRIDWNLYARLSKLFIKLYVEEVDLTLSVAVDASGSMAFGTPSKFDTARRIAAALGYVALSGLDRVRIGVASESGYAGFGPARGKRQIFGIFRFLEQATAQGLSDLTKVVAEQKPGGGGVTVLVSDFLSPTGPSDAVYRLLGARQRVVLLQVLAPEEIDPELYGDFLLVDSETGAPIEVTAGPRILAAYKANLRRLQAELASFSKQGPVTFVPVPSDVDVVDLMLSTLPKALVLR